MNNIKTSKNINNDGMAVHVMTKENTLTDPGRQPVPLQQSEIYSRVLEQHGIEVTPIEVTKNDQPIARAMVIKRQWLYLIRLQAILRGPIWLTDTVTEPERRNALQAIYDFFGHPNRLLLSPQDCATAQQLENIGFKKVASGDSTVWIDLTTTEDTLMQEQDGNWRNALRKAQTSHIIVEDTVNRGIIDDFISREQDQQTRNRYTRALPDNFVHLCHATDPDSILVRQARRNGRIIAGVLIIVHGSSATYHIGWSDKTGRQYNAHNLLLWRAVTALKSRGISYLDLDEADTVNSPGIARFKIGTGGQVTTYPGTYMPSLLSIFKF